MRARFVLTDEAAPRAGGGDSQNYSKCFYTQFWGVESNINESSRLQIHRVFNVKRNL